MACIIKIPSENSKGVVTFTTQERDKFILPNIELQKKIENIKEKWVIGLHHNWHDFNFEYNTLFDFSMAGETDLVEKNGKDVPLIPLDACNFSPNVFRYSKYEKFWDILYVAQAVNYKKIPEFFNVIKKLYEKGLRYRVLLISAVPNECANKSNSKTCLCNIRDIYNGIFNSEEQKYFTLLSIDYNYPFPFDIPSLAHFYRSSKIFVHTADQERRCRVIGYAMATGLPVVCLDAPASLYPKAKQVKPLLYFAKTYDDFPELIQDAIAYVDSENYCETNMMDAISESSETYTCELLVSYLAKYCNNKSEIDDIKYFNLQDLDLRLGRHHGFGVNANSIGWSIDSLLDYIKNASTLNEDIANADLERYITKYMQYGKIENSSLYVEPKFQIVDKIKYYISRILSR